MPTLGTKFRVHAKHPRVTELLRERIVSGSYGLGEQLPHRDELELELGASRATVQTALNTLLQEGFLRSVSGQGTFVAERPPFVTDYGLVFPYAEEEFGRNRFFAAIMSSARKLARSRGGRIRPFYGLTLASGSEYERAVAECRSHQLAGMIFAAVTYQIRNSLLLSDELEIPRVTIQDDLGPEFPVPSVYPDLNGFYRMAFGRCVSAGRRRVTVICADPGEARARQISAIATATGANCPVERVMSLLPHASDSCRWLVPLLFSLPKGERPEALIIADDNLVSDATAALLLVGVRVPDDLMVVAHGNLPQLARSHVRCDYVAFDAIHTIERCMECIDNQRRGETPARFTAIPPVLVPSEMVPSEMVPRSLS